jgi:hypothetical protein
MTRRFDVVPFMLLGCAMFLASCSDEPTQPAPSGLEEQTLSESPQGGAFLDLAFAGDQGMAVGAIASGTAPNQTFEPFLLSLDSTGTWSPDSSISTPGTGWLTAVDLTVVAVSSTSAITNAVIAGVDGSGSGFILDQRNGWSQHNVPLGGLALARYQTTLRLAGTWANNDLVLISTAPDVWTPETLPFPPGLGERGIQDVSARNGVWAACGFDDSGDGTPASPNSVFFVDQGTGWERVSVSCGGCSNWEFRSVAVAETGGILLGGAVTNFAGGANEYTASLLVRSVSGDWAEIVLSKPTELKRVNDILIAHDGTVYLACGMGEMSYLVRVSSGGAITRDATLTSARLNRLAESPDGSIWAAGAVLDGQGNVLHPAIWKRAG